MLHVLQDNRFERVGEHRPVDVDFRVIAATNKNLEEGIRNGQFRQDLFYRLNIVRVRVPPLRERLEDIGLLVEKLTQVQAKKTNRPEPVYSQGAIRKLGTYEWPGNVRELKNLVKRMMILRPGEKITENDIGKILSTANTDCRDLPNEVSTLADAQRQHIIQTMIKTRGVIGGSNGAARLLGLPRSTLQYRMKKLGIKPQEYNKK
jgi:DNA-binding NtrC family response regulator